jgi:hypothetical protein
MFDLNHSSADERPVMSGLPGGFRHNLGGRPVLFILAGIAFAGGLALNWNWLVAVGIAPLLLTALPCVAMCALDLCMKHGGGQPHSTDGAARPVTRSDEPDDR